MQRLYPDLLEMGGLGPAVSQFLGDGYSETIDVQTDWCIAVRDGGRHAGLTVGAEERGFSLTLGDNDFQHAYGWASELGAAVRVARAFLAGSAVAGLAHNNAWLTPSPGLAEYLAGPAEYVAWTWARLRAWLVSEEPSHSAMKAVVPLFEAACARPQLRQLLPFTSHTTLCFSRTTGYPFPMDCPYAYPLRGGDYRVATRPARGDDEVVIGEGDAERAAALLVAHLPPDCGPARHGSAED